MVQAQLYNKLVRDKIPAIIEHDGKTAVCHTATEGEYEERLFAKLAEEIAEFRASPCEDELADIMEVIHALRALHGFHWSVINSARKRKHQVRGGFVKRIILEKVIE